MKRKIHVTSTNKTITWWDIKNVYQPMLSSLRIFGIAQHSTTNSEKSNQRNLTSTPSGGQGGTSVSRYLYYGTTVILLCSIAFNICHLINRLINKEGEMYTLAVGVLWHIQCFSQAVACLWTFTASRAKESKFEDFIRFHASYFDMIEVGNSTDECEIQNKQPSSSGDFRAASCCTKSWEIQHGMATNVHAIELDSDTLNKGRKEQNIRENMSNEATKDKPNSCESSSDVMGPNAQNREKELYVKKASFIVRLYVILAWSLWVINVTFTTAMIFLSYKGLGPYKYLVAPSWSSSVYLMVCIHHKNQISLAKALPWTSA